MSKYYRYCFFCEKWKIKEEINEIDWGKDNKTFNCNVCRKDLGDTIQIFHCPNHQEIILKVWGILEGQNQEKIFFKECPKENQQEKQPDSGTIGKRALWFIGGGVALIGGFVLLICWLFKRGKENE